MVIVGDSGVGKTSILTRFVLDLFQEGTSSTIGVDFFTKSVKRGNNKIKTQLWDTGSSHISYLTIAGQERYRAMAAAYFFHFFVNSRYYRGSSGGIIVFDVTCRQSFDNLQQWINEIWSYSSPDMPILIVISIEIS